MSSIAFYDRDFMEKDNEIRFNLQLMKLSSYHKRCRDMVSLITDLSRAPYYTKVYYRQNNPELSFPKELYQYDNIDIGGFAVNSVYEPLLNGAENILPDIDLYNREISKRKFTPNRRIQLQSQQGVMHLQLTADGEKISDFSWNQAEEMKHFGQKKHIIVHDTAIAPYEKEIPSFFETFFTNMDDNHPVNILFQYPLEMEKETVLSLARWGFNIWTAPIYVKGCLDSKEALKFFSRKNLNRDGTTKVIFSLPGAQTYLAQCNLFLQVLEDSLMAQTYTKVYNYITPPMGEQMTSLFERINWWSAYNARRGEKTLCFEDTLREDIRNQHYDAVPALRELEKIERMFPKARRLATITPTEVKKNGGIIPL